MTETPKIIQRIRQKAADQSAEIQYHPVLKSWREKHGLPDDIFPYQTTSETGLDFLNMLSEYREVTAKRFEALPGLYFDRKRWRWRVRIHYQNTYKFIGYFASYREAVAAR